MFFPIMGLLWIIQWVMGGSTFDSSGRRHSAADLLSYAKASNIRVAVYASLERILLASYSLDLKWAIGVVFRDQTRPPCNGA